MNTYKVNEEAVKKIAERVYDNGSTVINRNDLEEMFPALKESEDERIRKELIAMVKLSCTNGDDADKKITWLEKQGEHAKFRDSIQVGDKVTRNRDGVLVNLSQLERVAKPAENKGEHDMGISDATKQELEDDLNKALEKETPESWNEFLEKQGEQKPDNMLELKFGIGDVVKRGLSTLRISSINFKKRFYELSTKEGTVVSCVPFSEQDNWELVAKNTTIRPKYCLMSNSPYCPYYNKQQHAWSKEDEENLNWFEKFFRTESVIAEGKDIPQDRYMWFKNLKDRVQPQPKQEWSEQEQVRINRIVACFENLNVADNDILLKDVAWLKSLIERYTWKPSEGQMKLLREVQQALLGKDCHNRFVNFMYELKKLREE